MIIRYSQNRQSLDALRQSSRYISRIRKSLHNLNICNSTDSLSFTFAIYLCLPIPRYRRRSLFEDYQALYYSLSPESAQWLLNRHRRIRMGNHPPSLQILHRTLLPPRMPKRLYRTHLQLWLPPEMPRHLRRQRRGSIVVARSGAIAGNLSQRHQSPWKVGV